MIRRSTAIAPVLACGLAYVVWGLNTPFTKISLEALTVSQLLIVKFLLGSIVFGALALRKWQPMPKDIRLRVGVATICGYVLTTALLYKGIELTGGLNATLIFLLTPLVLFLFSIKFLKEKFNSKLLVGVITGLMGAILIIGGPLLAGDNRSDGNVLGNALIVGAIFTDVMGTIIIKPMLARVSVIQMAALRFWIATLVLLPFSIGGLASLGDVSLDMRTIISLAYGLIFGTLVAFYLFQWGLRKVSGEQLSTLHYLDPMVGAVGSIVLLGDRLTTTMIAGICLILGGLYASGAHKIKINWHITHHR